MMVYQNPEMHSTIPADYLGLAASEIQFQKLLTQLIEYPPTFVWGVSMDDFDNIFKGYDEDSIIEYITKYVIYNYICV